MGLSTNTSIYDCVNTGDVKGKGTYVGGIAGQACSISNSYNISSIVDNTGYSFAGGIVGNVYDSASISNCYNTANVFGSSYVGGISGKLSSGKIENVYNFGDVSGTSVNVGGVTGYMSQPSSGSYSIKDSVNIGNIYGTGNDIGSITGFANSTTINYVENCKYLTGTCEWAIGARKVDGDATAVDTPPALTDYLSGYKTISRRQYLALDWEEESESQTKLNLINENNSYVADTNNINNGYPILKWQVE